MTDDCLTAYYMWQFAVKKARQATADAELKCACEAAKIWQMKYLTEHFTLCPKI